MEHDENHGFLACYRAMSVVSKVLAIGGFSVPLFACNALAGIEQPVDPGSDTGDANSAADQWVADVTNAPDEGTSVDHRLTPDVLSTDGGNWCATQAMFDFCTDFDVSLNAESGWMPVYKYGGGVIERSATFFTSSPASVHLTTPGATVTSLQISPQAVLERRIQTSARRAQLEFDMHACVGGRAREQYRRNAIREARADG